MEEEEDLNIICNSELLSPIKHVSLLNSGLTTKERLGIIWCRPSFRLRSLKNKGAILVLIWSYLCVSLPYFYLKESEKNHGIGFNLEIITLGLTLSIAGWIADVRFGRYRVMHLSMWFTWAALMLATVSSISAKAVYSYGSNKAYSYVNGALRIVMALGFGGFQANIIQFGLDQLHDASSNEISSFIVWYNGSAVVVTM